MKKLKFIALSIFLSAMMFLGIAVSGYALPDECKDIGAFTQRAKTAKNKTDFFAALRSISGCYFKDNKYNDFIGFLNDIGRQKKKFMPEWNYYFALTRYLELRHLDEAQNWDEYFSQGNTYRQELEEKAGAVIQSTKTEDPLNLYAKLLLWNYSKEQQDGSSDARLEDLLKSVLEYSRDPQDIAVIKEAADQLSAHQEKNNARKLYKIYVEKLNNSSVTEDELRGLAEKFYDQENVELSESVYDIYLERVKNYEKEKLIPILAEIARRFVYHGQPQSDPAYAEKIFAELEKLGGDEAFDEELMYLRGINLEKSRYYEAAKEAYALLLKRFPGSKYRDELNFRSAMIYAYILHDPAKGKEFFGKLKASEGVNPEIISSLYQLGLLAQWEGDSLKAKEFYDALISRAKDGYPDYASLANQRLLEIQGQMPIEYNLKTFLDVSLGSNYNSSSGNKVDLRSLPYQLSQGQDTQVNSFFQLPESGCFQVQMQYLWSGDLGGAQPTNQDASFTTQYVSPGIKVVNLVVVSPSGVFDHSLDIITVD